MSPFIARASPVRVIIDSAAQAHRDPWYCIRDLTMSYELTETERNAALQLNADYRFDHFISKLVEHEELFVLTDEHGVMMLTTEDEDCIPVWPHPEYAQAWAEGEWAECKPQSITLKVWLERWVEGMEQDELCVAVFPTPDQEGIVLEPADVADAVAQKQAKRG